MHIYVIVPFSVPQGNHRRKESRWNALSPSLLVRRWEPKFLSSAFPLSPSSSSLTRRSIPPVCVCGFGVASSRLCICPAQQPTRSALTPATLRPSSSNRGQVAPSVLFNADLFHVVVLIAFSFDEGVLESRQKTPSPPIRIG